MGVVEWLPGRVDREAAVAFMRNRGGLREQARLAGILDGVRPERAVVRELEQLQNADGGFPLWLKVGGPSSLDVTCYVLFQLMDMPPLTGSPMASRAISFIRRHQAVDGSWVELPEAAEAGPSYGRQGNPKAQGYLTASAAYTLLILAPEQAEPVRRGAAWLRQALEDATKPQAAMTLAMTWAIRYQLESGGGAEVRQLFDQALARCSEAWVLAWMLSCALAVRAGGEYLLPVLEALVRLAGMQEQDGGWPGEKGLPLEGTVTALRVFRGYGLI